MNIFKKDNSKDKLAILFEVGEIYRMSIGKRSHVRHPYYVQILKVDPNFIITNIPCQHSLKISKDNNWDYQVNRMTFIGNKNEFGHLLLNQDLYD